MGKLLRVARCARPGNPLSQGQVLPRWGNSPSRGRIRVTSNSCSCPWQECPWLQHWKIAARTASESRKALTAQTCLPVIFMFMLWFNFISLCFKLIIIHYHTPKQREIKFEPRIKLNHNIYMFGEYSLTLRKYTMGWRSCKIEGVNAGYFFYPTWGGYITWVTHFRVNRP